MQQTTPHTTTGVAPLKLMQDREIRDKRLRTANFSSIDDDWMDLDRLKKYKEMEAVNQNLDSRDESIAVDDQVLEKRLNKSGKWQTNSLPPQGNHLSLRGTSASIRSSDCALKDRRINHFKEWNGRVIHLTGNDEEDIGVGETAKPQDDAGEPCEMDDESNQPELIQKESSVPKEESFKPATASTPYPTTVNG